MTDSPARLAELVKARADDLGFAPIGIAAADPFEADLARTLVWLERGHSADMAWMTPERAQHACHPDDLLAGARSLVVVGAPYTGRDTEPGDAVARGRVARYARGADYHDVMKARLTSLADFVRELGGPDTRTRVFVDSSPLPERAAAQRAGLGFIGKNTLLLTAPVGSWLVLGALLTDLEIAPDRPNTRDCGQCRLCLDACPTGALPEPYLLDAHRCISYLTIEHREAIPRDLRPMMGDHVFGCDICQDVCPWNRRDRGPGWTALGGSADAGHPALADLLALDDAAFRERYRRTPVWRTKRRGMLRNAAVALGNVGSALDLPALTTALHDDEPLVRAHAAWAIGRIGTVEGARALRAARAAEQDAAAIEEIEQALAELE